MRIKPMQSDAQIITVELEKQISELSESLCSTKEAKAFLEAKRTFEKDEEALDLMTRMNTLGFEIQQKKEAGILQEYDTELYAKVSRQFLENPAVARLEAAQKDLRQLYESVNTSISDALAFPFIK
ncbi:MAG: YlbF family regulator [Balneolales bacterium]|nr:YlbF family regulator [Balneolales bacterium]